jgi:hypothetical protein
VAEAGLCSGLGWSVGPGDFGIVAGAIVYVGIAALLLDQGYQRADHAQARGKGSGPG